ncbi:hypothetical protein F7725_015074 [Dissostichus mawsoni]|uniref:Uncharacterized protein n=1 Tax=Dissostichus mawsoni TaxID=36200 RepID=A0A7J5YJC3_DISMA|nr:hypothetical protein F7725_015074 [Dissostichus mawsoni]
MLNTRSFNRLVSANTFSCFSRQSQHKILLTEGDDLLHLISRRLRETQHTNQYTGSQKVLAGALKVETLPQVLLAVSRQVEEVHVAHGQLLTLGDLPHSSQLDPATEEKRFLDLIAAFCHLSNPNIVSRDQMDTYLPWLRMTVQLGQQSWFTRQRFGKRPTPTA